MRDAPSSGRVAVSAISVPLLLIEYNVTWGIVASKTAVRGRGQNFVFLFQALRLTDRQGPGFLFSLYDILYNILYNLKIYDLRTTTRRYTESVPIIQYTDMRLYWYKRVPRADTAQVSVDLVSFGVTQCSYGFTWWVYDRKKQMFCPVPSTYIQVHTWAGRVTVGNRGGQRRRCVGGGGAWMRRRRWEAGGRVLVLGGGAGGARGRQAAVGGSPSVCVLAGTLVYQPGPRSCGI